ncbi:MAG: hypothetical protein WA117_19515 [Verrucomicrobiia bacterium]
MSKAITPTRPGAAAGERLKTKSGAAPKLSALDRVDARLDASLASIRVPSVRSFKEFLLTHARIKVSTVDNAGSYSSYTLEGREALEAIIDVIDLVIGSAGGGVLKDSTIVIAGGAQFGKTILELNLAAYIAAVRFMNPVVYMPDDQLAADIVDAKFRPDVVDQIPWFAAMTKLGKSVNESGRAVDTKGAFLVTDGDRKAVGMYRGLKKIPTSFSADVAIRDEEDDIDPKKAKFVSGRMTVSALRLNLIVGTQRIAGAGQHKQWENGSQGVMLLGPFGAELLDGHVLQRHSAKCVTVSDPPPGWINPEEHWPQICRCAITGTPRADDPQLTWEGDFRRVGSNDVVATYTPDGNYYLADPRSGLQLNRNLVAWHHRRPERIKQRRWSFRLSQFGVPAIDLAQIVAHWTRAVADADEMNSFACDRRAMPKSSSQALTPQIIARARGEFDYGMTQPGILRVAGLDTGDRCWMFIREIENAAKKRAVRFDSIALGDMVGRTLSLCAAYDVGLLCIDERPAVSEARTLAMILNGLDQLERWPAVDFAAKDSRFSLPNGLEWNGEKRIWKNLRCAVVRFSKNQIGAGIEQGAAEFVENGQTKFVPMIACNRFETIDRVVREFLTPSENVIEVVDVGGKREVRQTPAILLPRKLPGAPAILDTLDSHLLTGSQRAKNEKSGELADYVDKVDNHLLLADAYSGLAELLGGIAKNTRTGGAMDPAAVTTVGFGRWRGTGRAW